MTTRLQARSTRSTPWRRPLAFLAGVLLVLGAASPGANPVHAQADVIVGDITGPGNFGGAGGYRAYSAGTTSCNIGTVPLDWFAGTNQHPVIAQHLYRLKDGRFEQIGIGWLKHGFTALQQGLCSSCSPHPNGTRLGVGCSDPYSSGLNASQSNGPRFEVNATTGFFPFPYITDPPVDDTTSRRVRVAEADVMPSMNPGALYFLEGQYVTPDDAAAGNHHNNSSYRPVTVNGSLNLSFSGSTVREKCAIEAWTDFDPTVSIDDFIVDGGRFIVGTKVVDLGNGFWSYEYAVHNMNSDRSAGAFTVPVPTGVVVQNIGFHDVEYHSGSPIDGTDWVGVQGSGAISWATDTFASNSMANAIRWGTLYNFRFEANTPPMGAVVTLGLFKSGASADPTFVTDAPGPVTGSTNPVTLVSCTANDFEAQLSWTNNGSYDSVILTRDGAPLATLPGSSQSYSDAGLLVGNYEYRITALEGGVASPASICSVDILPPTSPSNLLCTPGGTQVQLSWTNTSSYVSLELERNGVLIATLPGTDTSYLDTGLPLGSYTYSLVGFGGGTQTSAANCSADIVPPPPLLYQLSAPDLTATYEASTGVGSFTQTVSLLEDPTNPGYPNLVSAYSVAFVNDPVYLQATQIQLTSTISGMNGGSGPDFFAPFSYPGGITAGVVLSFSVDETIQASSSLEILTVEYATVAANLAGNFSGTTTLLTFQDEVIGNPPVDNAVVVGIDHVDPVFQNSVVTLDPVVSEQTFIRGDADGSGTVNLADVITSLQYQLAQGSADCLKALDANDDSGIDVSDPVSVLEYLFGAGAPLSAPFPACGVDPTADSLTCDSSVSCP